MIISFLWANMHIGYQLGMSTGKTDVAMGMSVRSLVADTDAQLRYPADRNNPASLAMGFGFLMTLLLIALKLRFAWWPLHPVAFPTVVGWMTMEMFPVFLGVWLFKVVLLRYGGLRAHHRALPFFLGLRAGGLVGDTISRVALRVLFRGE